MPTREQLIHEVEQARRTTHDQVRRRYLKELADHTGRDTILYASAFTSVKLANLPGNALSISHQDIQGFMASLHGLKADRLDLVLHSPGGSAEAADQLVQYLRSKYKHIRAIVPQNAMSAATMIACACDEIVMGKQSALGPIDPQITFPTPNGHFTSPAHAILAEFEQARAEILADQRSAPLWITKLQSYPPGFLNICRDTIQQAKDKVSEWLRTYMFGGRADGPAKAAEIADWLGDASNHKTHGRPISMTQAADKGLVVVRLEDDQTLQDKALSLFHAVNITFEVTNCVKVIENHNGKGWYLQVSPQ